MINQNHLILLSFGKWGDTEGGANLGGHCFVLTLIWVGGG